MADLTALHTLRGTSWRWVVAFVVVMGALAGARGVFTDRPLDGHEVLVAQSAREMLASGDWVLPTFNAEPRLKKPPLMYWLVMVGREVFPVDDVAPWVARLPSLLAAIGLVGATIWVGAMVYDRRSGLLAGAMLGSSVGFFVYANSARPEMLYASCCGVMLVGFLGAWRPWEESGNADAPSAAHAKQSRWSRQLAYALVGWVGVGLACMAKGPHLPGVLLGGLVLHAVIERRLGALWRALYVPAGLLVVGVIVLPWIVLLETRSTGGLSTWKHELLSNSSHRGGGVMSVLSPYYLYAIPQLILPWAILLPFGLFVSWERTNATLRRGRVLFWIVIVAAIIMTIPNHRRSYYMLPILPALFPLMARGTIDVLVTRCVKGACARIAACASGVLIAAPVVILVVLTDSPRQLVVLLVLFALVMAGMAMALLKQPLREMRLVKLIAPPMVAWAALFALAGHLPGWWDPERYEEQVFHDVAAQAIGQSTSVYAWRVDEAVLAYALNRHVEEIRTLDTIFAHPPSDAVWIVTRESHLETLRELPEGWSWRVAGEQGNGKVLLCLSFRESKTPPEAAS